jgi:hypothetical protein
MRSLSHDITDAAELTEMLQFRSDWLARDPAPLAASLEEFVGHPAYGLAQLRDDLDRFIFLLGGNDGENPLACGTRATSTCAPGHRAGSRPAGRGPGGSWCPAWAETWS